MNEKQLLKQLQGREPLLPDSLLLEGARPQLLCETPLRILPNQRLVFKGHWKDIPIVAKLFIDKKRKQIHFQREVNGHNILIKNNILTPNIVGNYVKINPFMIILGIIAGGMVWGIPGMFVVIPFLAMIRIISEHVPALNPYVYLLGTGGTRRYALTGENIKRYLNQFKSRRKRNKQVIKP